MYTRCIFCNGALGTNEAIEHFPVGRKLAFDAAKGRLWVVCPKCERWNLSPLEERWEAIEEAERAYRDTRKRVATDNIGLARVADGTSLVRIGAPLRPEFAAWRYGDQFGKRRRKQFLLSAGAVGALGGAAIVGPLIGMSTVLAANTTVLLINYIRYHKSVAAIVNDDGVALPFTRLDAQSVRFDIDEATREPRVICRHQQYVANGVIRRSLGIPFRRASETGSTTLNGAIALRAMATTLPFLNGAGASAPRIGEAVKCVEAAPEFLALLRTSIDSNPAVWGPSSRNASAVIPVHLRLALEMSLHEDDERRALEGDLHLLEARWKQAEEIAAIADGLL